MMEYLPEILLAGIGIISGMLLGRLIFGKSKQASALQKELETLQKEYIDYKSDVNQHFSQTADLVNEMTDSYKAVHKHLSSGAQQLGQKDTPPALAGSSRFIALSDPVHADDEQPLNRMEQPRDYAEKDSTEVSGTLAEDFGLQRKPAISTTETGIPTIAEGVDIDVEINNQQSNNSDSDASYSQAALKTPPPMPPARHSTSSSATPPIMPPRDYVPADEPFEDPDQEK